MRMCDYTENIECPIDGFEDKEHCELCLMAMLVDELRRLRVTGIQP